ncbi:MAG: tripartite tricarboxylate transporter TctB family protein [Synergistetes bacterium]|nr:tripartite tricarboxylate transporter TctB family protein [Synergistota bacterium]MCX8127328.1 tripartite tricarboxylate transporter TctB family protein [Synergistota bacterium]MDW8192192.1 tripartite tricarboxylate transporter TctB family protein [Synergistota bacterium]
MGIGDLILGISCIALSIFVFYYSRFFPKYTSGAQELPGPSFFPRLLAIFIIAFGIYFVIYGIYRVLKNRDERRSFNSLEFKDLRSLLSYVLVLSTGFIVYPVLNFFGTIVGFTVIGIFLMRIFKVKWITSIIYSFAMALIINWIFKGIFKLPLPDDKIFLLLRG